MDACGGSVQAYCRREYPEGRVVANFEARNPIISEAAFGSLIVISGIIEASTMRPPSAPRCGIFGAA
ncbi:MAG: hypothetical protein BGN89_15030 [Alphaproteobacteria bacterium 64-6]|nr:MAG: hypothetical protein BGN89_15030 [Alphaproteobacteria bacterium 64-6]